MRVLGLMTLVAVVVTVAVLGGLGTASGGADPQALSAAAGPAGQAVHAKKKPKCERRVYRRAKVCRDGRYRKNLLWHPKRRNKAVARRGRRPCVHQTYLSSGVKAKAEVLFGGPVCVERKVFANWSLPQLEYIWGIGLSRCMIMNASPGGGFGTLFSLARAANFCRAEFEGDSRGYRGWGYVLLG